MEILSYHDRCRLLNSDPFLVGKHFQYFKETAVDGPLGKTKYYAIHVEFQVCNSPHVHCFLWPAQRFQLRTTRKCMLLLLTGLFILTYLTNLNTRNFMI